MRVRFPPIALAVLSIAAAVTTSCDACTSASACTDDTDCPGGTECVEGTCGVVVDREGEGETGEGEGEVAATLRLIERGFSTMHTRSSLSASDGRVVVDDGFEALATLCASNRCITGGFTR